MCGVFLDCTKKLQHPDWQLVSLKPAPLFSVFFFLASACSFLDRFRVDYFEKFGFDLRLFLNVKQRYEVDRI